MVFKIIKLTSKAVFFHLYQNILSLFTIKWPLFFKIDKKAYVFIKNFISIFSGQCPQCATMSPMCNNVPNVQHFFGEFRCCTLGAPGVECSFESNLTHNVKFTLGNIKWPQYYQSKYDLNFEFISWPWNDRFMSSIRN